MGTRREHILKIRFSDDEWKQIHATFPKRKVGTAIRALALAQEAPRRSPALEARRETLLAVARLGNNLNQIARGINRANLAGEKIEAVRIHTKLVEIQDALEKL
ncbi:MAG: plasmid mobilization relaxosome protein MobC [Verrucomicrobiota bacterium]